eukprot:s164_g40.t1
MVLRECCLKWIELLQLRQFAREVTCAVQLVSRLDRWVMGRNQDGWTTGVLQETAELAQVSFGGRLLRTIGWVYECSADQFIASCWGNFTVDGHLQSWKDGMHSTEVKIKAMSSVAKSGLAVKEMTDAAGSGMSDEDQAKRDAAARQALTSLEGSLPVFLQAIWDISQMDIESTVYKVCDRALKDISVPWQIRYRRAIALKRLGQIFRDAGQETLNRIKTHRGVVGIVIVNSDGAPIRTTLDKKQTEQYAELVSQLAAKARSVVRDLDPMNDLTFLRIRSKKHEIMVAPDREYILIVIQDPNADQGT